MDPHYYNADEFAMNFEEGSATLHDYSQRLFQKQSIWPQGAGALAGAAMMVLPSVRATS
jgi:hypothetical protein